MRVIPPKWRVRLYIVDAQYGHNAVWAGSHLSPLGFSVLTKPEIAGLNDFLRL
jgi:hypothetical protein